jgi:Holliday junction resolvase RusA-like endonuclease
MNSQSRIKLLQLRKFKKNFGFLSHYQGPILTKGGLNAKRESQNIKLIFLNDGKRFNWVPPPRAHIAISFKIFCGQKNPPEIYHIPKYYLDLLEGPVFKNDRQVRYLEASIWRSAGNASGSEMFIQAWRLIDLFKMWNLYQDIDERFCGFDEEIIFPFRHLIDQKLWDIAEAQYRIIENSNISQYDRPGLKKYIGPTMMSRFRGIDPFIFDFGQLPGKGESKDFQKNLSEIIKEFTLKYPLFKKIYLPIELDIQITKSSFKTFKRRDLDNIAINICKGFRKSVLYQKVYINGYRIYVVDCLEDGIESGVRLKLFPAGAIKSYNDKMEKALIKYEKELSNDLRV